jgi:hypothetical protein
MFEDGSSKKGKKDAFNEGDYPLYTTVDEDREMRCDIMFMIPSTKHIEIKFFDFFTLIMRRVFS